MSGGYSGPYRRESSQPTDDESEVLLYHSITVRDGKLCRDARPMKIRVLGNGMFKIGCTTISLEAIRLIVKLVERDREILQDGAE